MTPGASGAELANIVNEAALCAVRHRRKAVTQYDLQEAVDTILAGAQKKNKILNDKEKCIVAYHEVGHAMVAALQSHSAPRAENHHRAAHFRRAGFHHAGRGRRPHPDDQGGDPATKSPP